MTRGEALIKSIPRLLTSKFERRDHSQNRFRRLVGEPKHAISMEPRPTAFPSDLKALSPILGICEVIIPTIEY